MTYFIDYGQVQSAKEMADGSIAFLGRVAAANRPMFYIEADGSSNYKAISRDELFKPSSVETLKIQTLTYPHSTKDLTPDSYSEFVAGSTGNLVIAGLDGDYLGIVGKIKRRDAIQAYHAGIRELSPGYDAKLTLKDDIYWQSDRDYFELALVDRARGGHDIKIKDSQPNRPQQSFARFDPAQIDAQWINQWASISDGFDQNAIDRLLVSGTLSPPSIIIPATIPTINKNEMDYIRIIIGGIELNVDNSYAEAAKDLQLAFDKAKAASEVAAKSVKDSASIELKLQDALAEIETLKTQVASTETAIKDGIAEQVKNLQAATADLGLFAATGIDTTLAKTCLDASDMVGLQKAIVVAKFPAKAAVDTATAAILYDSIRDHAIDSLQKQKDMMGMGLSMQTAPMGYPGTIQMQTQPNFTMPAMIQQVGGGPTNATVAGLMGAEELAIANGSVGGFPHGLPPKSDAWTTAPK